MPGSFRRAFPNIVSGYELTPDMGYFSVVIPEETTNLIDNPSFEFSTTGYTALGSGTMRVDSSYARRGVRSLHVVPSATFEGVRKTISAGLTAGTDYCWSFDIRVPLNRVVRATVTEVSSAWSVVKQIYGDGKWHRYYVSFRYPSGSFYLILGNPFNVFEFFTDGWQLENKGYPTTYCDGDMIGYIYNQQAFLWNGVPHASSSKRILQTGAGGREKKLSDIGFNLLAYTGLGMPDIENISTDLWQGGAYYQRTIEKTRSFSIVGAITGLNTNDLNRVRNDLVKAFYDRGLDSDQPVLLRYYPADGGEEDVINIPCFLEGGLQGSIDNKNQERIGMTFRQFNPVLSKETFASSPISIATPLNGNTWYLRKADGTWNTFVTDSVIVQLNRTVYDAARNIMYLFGSFASMNGIANTSRIAKYIDAQITAMGTGAADGQVIRACVAPNGDVYVCGSFTSMGGVAKTKYIAKWNYATQAWESLYTGADPNSSIFDVAIDNNGYVFVVGDFTSISGVAANRIAVRSPGPSGTWSAIGTGLNAGGQRVVVDRNNRVFVAGGFTTANGVTTGPITRVSVSRTTFELLVTGVVPSGGPPDRIAISPDGNMYLASSGGVAINWGSFSSIIAKYNGSGFYPLQGNIVGANGIDFITTTSGGTVVVGGNGFYLSDLGADYAGIFFYRNGKWLPWEREEIFGSEGNRPISWTATKGGDVFVTDYEGQYTVFAGNTTIVNSLRGTQQTEIIFTGPLVVHKIANNRTGQNIYFNKMNVLQGETVVLKNIGSRHIIYSSLGRNMSGFVDKDAKGLGIAQGVNIITMVVGYGYSTDFQNIISNANCIPYIGNVNDTNSDFGKLYLSVTFSAPNYTYVFYKDAARTQQVAHTANFSTAGAKALIADGGSGLSGYAYCTLLPPGAAFADAGYAVWGMTILKYTQETLDLVK